MTSMPKLITNVDDVTDLYLPANSPTDGYMYPGRVPIPDSMYPMVMSLVETAKKNALNDSTLSYRDKSFRCHRMPTAQGEYYIFRRMPATILTLKEIGLPGVIANNLMSPRLLKGGLVIVAGLPGNGKSTTLGSLIVSRLEKFGGICITVEDPVEMPLQGNHGEGLCLQRSVENQGAFAGAIRDALRAYPAKTAAMMMIGEVRDPEVAGLALRSAVDGRLVLLTMHAGDVIQAIHRLCVMASRVMPMEEVREILGSSFRLAMHQALVTGPDDKIRLRATTLMDTVSVVGTIRQKSIPIENLKNDVNMQMNCLRQNIPVELRPID